METFLPTKTGKKFLDFIKSKVVQKYDDGNIKQIFLILDNVSIHKSNNKVKETLARYHHPRIQLLVFLPTTRSPELNLIEVRWLYGCT
jgi:transposase